MAVVPAPAIPITGPGVYPIPYPGGGTQPTGASHQWTQVKLENASPYPMTFNLGGTPVHSLPAGVADVFALTLGPSGPGITPTTGVDAPAQPLTVTVGPAQSPVASNLGTLRPSFGQYGDQFPGVYPVTLPGNLFAPALTPAAGVPLPSVQFTLPANSPIADVHLYSEILLQIQPAGPGSPTVQYYVQWYNDQAGTQPILTAGQLYQFVNAGNLGAVSVVLACEGPFVQLQPGGPAGFSVQLSIVGFPQPVPRGTVIQPQIMLSVQNLPLAAGVASGLYNPIQPYTPGRFRIFASGSQSSLWRIYTARPSGVNDVIWQQSIAAAGVLVDDIVFGADSWQALLENTSATAANLFLVIIGPNN